MEEQVQELAESIAPVEQQAQPMLSQEQVNKIVAREKAKAADAARREVESRYQQELEKTNALREQQEQRNQQVSRDVDVNSIYQQVQEQFNKEMQERQLKEQMTHVANQYLSKVEQGKANYEDWNTVTQDFDPAAFPQLTFLLAGIENAGDVLYDLAKNPMKLAAVDRLAEKNPRQAQSELLKLSKSITENRAATQEAKSQGTLEPLDRLQPSRVSGSNGKMSIRDLRNQPWLRG